MAKELPYFKFEPSEWLEGEIQIISDTAIVCFINLCSGYWLKLGCISYAFALHKYCRKDRGVLQELISNNIIQVVDDEIRISFLDNQFEEFKGISEKRSNAAKKRWRKNIDNQQVNASAMQLDSKSNAIREDKSKEDKSKIEKSIIPETKVSLDIDFDKLLDFFNKTTNKKCRVISKKVKNQFNARLKEGYTKTDIFEAIKNCSNDPYHVENPKYLTLEFISRPDKLDKYSNYKKSASTNITTTADDNR